MTIELTNESTPFCDMWPGLGPQPLLPSQPTDTSTPSTSSYSPFDTNPFLKTAQHILDEKGLLPSSSKTFICPNGPATPTKQEAPTVSTPPLSWDEATFRFRQLVHDQSIQSLPAMAELVRSAHAHHRIEALRDDERESQRREAIADKRVHDQARSSAMIDMKMGGAGFAPSNADEYRHYNQTRQDHQKKTDAINAALFNIQRDVFATISEAIGDHFSPLNIPTQYTRDTYFVVAAAFEALKESTLAHQYYLLASTKAEDKATAIHDRLLAISQLPANQLASYREELHELVSRQLPALLVISKRWEAVTETATLAATITNTLLEQDLEAASPQQIRAIREAFVTEYGPLLYWLGHNLELHVAEPLLATADRLDTHASNLRSINADNPDAGPIVHGTSLGTFSPLHVLDFLSVQSPLNHFVSSVAASDEFIHGDRAPIFKLLGLAPDSPLWNKAGYHSITDKSNIPMMPGDDDTILSAQLLAWEQLYRFASTQSTRDRRLVEADWHVLLESHFYPGMPHQSAQSAMRFAGHLNSILSHATARGGDIEATLFEDGPKEAQERLAVYQGYTNKMTSVLEPFGHSEHADAVHELVATLRYRSDYMGTLAAHDYDTAFNVALPNLILEFGQTKTIQERITALGELYPHRFAPMIDGDAASQQCLVNGLDFTDSDIGASAAERELSAFDKAPDSYEHYGKSLFAGVGGAAAGCLVGGGIGGILGTPAPGVGNSLLGTAGCKIGSWVGGLIAAGTYELNAHHVMIEQYHDQIAAAQRAGVSLITEEEAHQNNMFKYGSYAFATLFSGWAGAGIGPRFSTLGYRAMNGMVRIGLTTTEKAAIRLTELGGWQGALAKAAEVAGNTKNAFINQAALLRLAPIEQTIRGAKWLSHTGSKVIHHLSDKPIAWYVQPKFWKRLWSHNIRDSFWAPLTSKQSDWLRRLSSDRFAFIGKGVETLFKLREPLVWVPGLAYGTYDYLEHPGQMSFLGGLGLAMPANQIGRIVFNLKTSGSTMYLAFAIGLEYIQQVQSGADPKVPDGWKVLTELVYAMPTRSWYTIIVQGRNRYKNSLIEPLLEGARKLAHTRHLSGKWFRSIENRRNENWLWRTATLPSGREFKLHTFEGRFMQLGALVPILAWTLWDQSRQQSANFERLFWQRLVDYGFGAFVTIPYIKAPLDMDTGRAEFLSRLASAPFRWLFGETGNKYQKDLIGLKTGLLHYNSSADYKAMRSKFDRSMESLHVFTSPFLGYSVDPLGIEGFEKFIPGLLRGGPHRNFNDRFSDVYNIPSYANISVGEAALRYLNFVDEMFSHYTYEPEDQSLTQYVQMNIDPLELAAQLEAEPDSFQYKIKQRARLILRDHDITITKLKLLKFEQ